MDNDDNDSAIVWSARRIPQLRGVARREYDRMADYFLALMTGIFLLVGFLIALMVGDVNGVFYSGLVCGAAVVFAVVVGGLAAAVLGKTNSGYDYRLDADGLSLRMAGLSRLMTVAGAAASSTGPAKAALAGAALTNLSQGIPWTELAERGAALEVVPAEHAVILHEPWGRLSLLSQPPRALYLFCETDERLAAVLALIRQCLPGIVEKPAEPNRGRRRLRITALAFVLVSLVGVIVF